jgi:hypothetical protein
LQIKTKKNSVVIQLIPKPVKQEVIGTMILPLLVFPGFALTLNRHNISGELYLMLLVTCAVRSPIASKYIKQNETENQ